uniref:Cytochrome c oxidase subunit 2 n=1 Tax=Gesiella jameensis TaxID=1960709 RepID=A0A8E7IUS7_9ANNE|nr:cytochrome c oxidase subunit 2 [Gesiella jameensis]
MSTWGQLNFQDAASPIMSQLIFFHDHAMLIVILIMSFVFYSFFSLFMNTLMNNMLFEAQQIETIWTIFPAFILLFLAFPSLRILYLTDEIFSPLLTLKTIGHQWYWSYQYSDFTFMEFDSYMIPSENLIMNQFRLLEVDNRVILPMNTNIRILITAADVIHSWTIPSLGIKVDAIPGRLNQTNMTMLIPGIFYGQCSEICGANHSFMPISIETVNLLSFSNWLKTNYIMSL